MEIYWSSLCVLYNLRLLFWWGWALVTLYLLFLVLPLMLSLNFLFIFFFAPHKLYISYSRISSIAQTMGYIYRPRETLMNSVPVTLDLTSYFAHLKNPELLSSQALYARPCQALIDKRFHNTTSTERAETHLILNRSERSFVWKSHLVSHSL